MILRRLQAAYMAFKDPRLVGEAEGMREVMVHVSKYDNLAVIKYDPEYGYTPMVHILTAEQAHNITRYLDAG